MTKVTTGRAGAVRIEPLKLKDLALAENHGKRLDKSSKSRVVYPDAPPLTTTGLDLKDLYLKHVEGVFTPKNNTKALHLLVQFPTELVDGEDAEYMLKHGRGFAEKVFGPRAIFADRVDRDEKGRHIVDLVLAPIYTKKTKHTEKQAVGLSWHTKKLANEYYPPKERTKKKDGRPRDINVYDIGRALQSAFFDYLQNEMGLSEAVRGEPKLAPGPDWKSAEELARAEIEKAKEAAEEKLKMTEQARAEAEEAKAAALKLQDEAKAERLRQEEMKAALQAASAKLQQKQADLHLRLAKTDEEMQAATLAKDDALQTLQRVNEERARLAWEQQRLGSGIGLLARGLDEDNGLNLRTDPYVQRGFAVSEEKLSPAETRVYQRWPAPLRQLGIVMAKMMENIRARLHVLREKEEAATQKQIELDRREHELAKRSAKLDADKAALLDQADEAGKLIDAARRESERTREELALHADWSRILNDLAEDKLQLISNRAGDWTIVAGSEPIPPRLQQRIQEPGPAWAQGTLKMMKALEGGANTLATQQREVAELKSKLTEVVAMVDRAFTPSQKSAVEAATSALGQDQQAAAWTATQRGSSVS